MNLITKRILISGAAGSIGSALTQTFLRMGAQVCAFDNSENGLFSIGQIHSEHVKMNKLKLFFGDIRDYNRLNNACANVDIIIHTAALKHVELSEYNVFDCVETNINGVKNIVSAAISNNVSKVLFTSSDKAVNPTSTMGTTKLLGEKIITAANGIVGTREIKFSSVRFGNVINSSGSIFEIFQKCKNENKPFPITHEDMSRFFITLKEAVNLILFSLEHMTGGEIFVKSMGAASIKTVARAIAGKEDIIYDIIGLKIGEKLFEELITTTEAKRAFKCKGHFIICPDLLQNFEISKVKSIIDSEKPVDLALQSKTKELDWHELKTMIATGDNELFN